ncbi:family 1 glycosylhydrolase [Arthrobacter sp. efr-133-TYG-118]|uniref:glycoside hydrolase family 1 protein n=1 Tax=Arthrobacter sp. efr-133-TYG-118 TaxID=3040279 RepID=UPI00254E457C|nr:family 1 glycosylhydrolase [Arthrobacter sp. efr-133-TYG-118]
MTDFPNGFLWGASTAPHQIEGNNVNSDWWANEQVTPGMALSGDAIDSYHRYEEDMRLLADAGLNAYRFGIEWARIEPIPGQFSKAELAHYRRMITTARRLGLSPVVTLHHFSSPKWFADEGSWLAESSVDRFRSFVTEATTILEDVDFVCTINEPNMLAMIGSMMKSMESGEGDWQSPTVEGDTQMVLPAPDPEVGRRLAEAHHTARDILKQRTNAAVGWTVANQALTAKPEFEDVLIEQRYLREDLYLEAARGDDFIGVQSYSTQEVDANGPVPHAPNPDNTLVGTAFRPDSLGIAVRHAWDVTGGVPILVTENGIAITDDTRRIDYTSQALHHLSSAIADGVRVEGYLHWSALDNYEWGHWEPTFGLIAVDRETFERRPKPSLAWLGEVARTNGLSLS